MQQTVYICKQRLTVNNSILLIMSTSYNLKRVFCLFSENHLYWPSEMRLLFIYLFSFIYFSHIIIYFFPIYNIQ